MQKKWMLPILALSMMAAAFLGCSSDDNSDTGEGEVSVTLSPTSLNFDLANESKKSATLMAYINGKQSADVTWKSSDPSVATVSDGVVTALETGTATITATAKADTTKTATCAVTVTDSRILTVTPKTLNLGIDETASVTASLSGVTWTSNRPEIASVASNGKVTAHKEGTAQITATLGSQSAYCDVTVEPNTTKESKKTEITVGTSLAAYDSFKYTGNGATIYIYSQSGGLNFYGIDVGGRLWNAGDFDSKDYTATEEFPSGGVTFTGVIVGDGIMSVDASSKTIAGKTFSKRFKIGGAGSQTGRCLKIHVESNTTFIFYACSSSDSDARTMIVEVVEDDAKDVQVVRPSGITLDRSAATLDRTDDNSNPTLTLKATITNAAEVTSGYETITWDSDKENVATVSNGKVTAVGVGTATITARTVNGKTATCAVTVTSSMSAKTISLTDKPVGYASLGTSYATSGGKTVTTRQGLIDAVKNGGVIIIDGMIDMSDGRLVAAGKKSTDSTPALDSFVNSANTSTKYSSYSDWRNKYAAACSLTTEDDKSSDLPSGASRSSCFNDLWVLNEAYGNIIKLNLQSNTTLIGKGPGCGIRGGTIQINGKSNIQIRNLTIQDPFDPFPHHEANDGYNAQWDGVNIQGKCNNIWIDHCTFEDTLTLGHVMTNGKDDEKWQTYDGLCDMKGNSEYITVSNCIFRNHDKTMLIGNSDGENVTVTRTVTLYRNQFFNCGQRMPMVRKTDVHVVNNYYDYDGSWKLEKEQQYAVGVRYNANVRSENNYFGSGINYSFSGWSDPEKRGNVYSSGDSDNSNRKMKNDLNKSTSSLFTPSYTIEKIAASDVPNTVKASAGAGYTLK